MGPMYTRTHDADDDGNVMTEIAAVWTDIEAPKAVEFAKFESNLADVNDASSVGRQHRR